MGSFDANFYQNVSTSLLGFMDSIFCQRGSSPTTEDQAVTDSATTTDAGTTTTTTTITTTSATTSSVPTNLASG